MRLGAVVRADDRGLGVLTWEGYRHLDSERVLVVREPGAEAKGFVPHLDRYPGATVVTYTEGTLPEAVVREWMSGLDVIYSAETFYDPRLVDWAREAGAATVLHVMPEFFRSTDPAPSVTWAPTPWRMDHLPPETRLVPVPVASDRFPMAIPERDGPLRVLHVAGHRAAGDRNGTLLLASALRYVRQPVSVHVTTQDPRMARIPRLPAHVALSVSTSGVANYWDSYADADVLVMPRRYGGLCLPVQEAMAAGLAVVMTDCAPNDWWPTMRVAGVARGEMNTPGGPIPLYAADARALAAAIDALASDPVLLRDYQRASLSWAQAHSWEALLPLYRAELERACN